MNIGRRGPHSLATIQKLFPILAEKRNEKAHHLSGGQQQMVAIGRALLCNPRLLLCDEISLGLAPIVIDQIYAAIPRIREAGTSIVLVEQDVSRSLAVSDRFYCLLEGEISLHGKPLETTQASVTAAYFGLERHR
jgi:branched-chain amino acid transport system ATP-binding protein